MNRDYETLDAIVVIGCLMIVSGMLYGFFTVQHVPESIVPVLASLATAILGIPVAYGAFRWGNNVGSKRAAEASAEAAKSSASALAQIAGATPIQSAPAGDAPMAAADVAIAAENVTVTPTEPKP